MSPFRYPGGKNQLYPFIEKLLYSNQINGTYVEPFAGGAALPIKLLLNNKVNNIWINDFDNSIYSVWKSILNHHNELIDKINEVPFDYVQGYLSSPKEAIKFWKFQKNIYLTHYDDENSVELAFATLFLNRTNTSGIINARPIGGLTQNGSSKIYSRFNKKTLIKKIEAIFNKKEFIKVTNLNAIQMISIIQNNLDSENSFIFFDPPYYNQGGKLYYSSFSDEDHQLLANKILSMHEYKWITTYDKAPQISALYQHNSQNFEYNIRYTANNKRRGTAPELMFASPALKIESFNSVQLSRI